MKGINDLVGLRVFERVVSLGSLTAAASELGMSLAATSKRLANFENRVGIQLIQRSTRKLAVSEEGRQLYQHALRIIAEIEEAEQLLIEQKGEVSGLLRISVPHSFGQRLLVPVLGDFCHQYSKIRLELHFNDEVEDMISEGIDIAIRYGELPDSRLVARTLLTNERILCASPAYLSQYGTPTSLDDLTHHRCIVIGSKADVEWRFLRKKVHVRGHIVCNDGEAVHNLALLGGGIVMKSYWDVMEDIQQGRLIQLLPDVATIPAPISLVYLRHQDLAPRIRVFIEHLSQAMSELAKNRQYEA